MAMGDAAEVQAIDETLASPLQSGFGSPCRARKTLAKVEGESLGRWSSCARPSRGFEHERISRPRNITQWHFLVCVAPGCDASELQRLVGCEWSIDARFQAACRWS